MAGNDDVDLPDLSQDAEGTGGQPLLTGSSIKDDDVKRSAQDLEAVFDVPVTVSAVLGKTAMEVSHLLKLGKGTV
ncbi:MAG: FliM/FliN family flagellar motor switch protein, partial [Rhizomicrobium sp.]